MAKCLNVHAEEIASKINKIRDKDVGEDPIKVYESFGKKQPEKMESRGSVGPMMTRLPSAVNKELNEKLYVFKYLEKALTKIKNNFIILYTCNSTTYNMNYQYRNIGLYVGNLPFDATEHDVENLVKDCGQLRSCIIRRHSEHNRINVYAQLEYRHEVECVEVFRTLLGKEFKGRTLYVNWRDDYYRQKYPELVSEVTSLIPISVAEKPFDISSQPPKFDGVSPYMTPNKLQLVDNKGYVTPYGLELAQKMDLNDVYNLLSKIYKLSQRTPSVARALLTENPSACYVLLQAQALLGNSPKDLDLESTYSINTDALTLSKSLEYFVNVD